MSETLAMPRKRLIMTFGLIIVSVMLHRGLIAWGHFWLVHDSGTVGLMAQHILTGERPLFMYGFNYSGALFTYYTAAWFLLLGQSTTAMLAASISLAALHALVTFLFFRDLL